MRRLTPIAAALLLLDAAAAFADDAPAPALRQAPSFVLAEGLEPLASAACLPGAFGEDTLTDAVEQALREAELDPQIAIVLTSGPLSCGSLFYLPIANDARGLGYQHEDAREVFDDSPDSRLEGVAFLNDWPYWRQRRAEFETAFLHEVGHRWGARVHAQIDGADSDELLGRERKHWSYFTETGGSPLEGNRFASLGDERYEASTPLGTGTFSQLDLYLMGVLPAAEVEPFFVLRADVMEARDCKDLSLNEASPPQFCAPLELTAERIEVSIDDVIAIEGERAPAPVETPREIDVAVLVLSSNAEQPLQTRDCEDLSGAIDMNLAAFEAATGGRMRLENLARSTDASCAGWDPPPPDETASCTAVQSRARHTSLWPFAFVLLLLRVWSRRPRGH